MEMMDRQEQLETLLRQLPEVEPSPVILESVMARIQPKKRPFWRRLALNVQALTLPCKLAAATLCLCLAFWAGSQKAVPPVLTSVPAGTDGDKALTLPAGNNAEANFLIGRGLLAAGDSDTALPYLMQATALAPQNSEYAVWAGVGSAAVGDYVKEQREYERAIMLEPENLQARLYLGHNFANTGRYSDAVRIYDLVLAEDPTQPVALYDKALMFDRLGLGAQLESNAWKAYLDQYRKGKWAYQALEHLNTLGDFSYRAHQVGNRRVILSHAELWALNREAKAEDVSGLQEVVGILAAQSEAFVLHIIAYDSEELSRAKAKAQTIRQIIRDCLPKSRAGQVQASWFGVPEVKVVAGKQYSLGQSITVFGYSAKRKEVAI